MFDIKQDLEKSIYIEIEGNDVNQIEDLIKNEKADIS